MTDVRERLERIGLGEYAQRFLDERFDTWKTLSDITEQDLQDLGVKLGHRRKLQRDIAEWRRQSREAALASPHATAVAQFELPTDIQGAGSTTQDMVETQAAGSVGFATRTKRKYRRHPKPDSNAPERPPSAYVIFSNHVRDLLRDQDLSFTEMAKVVGERWQVLPSPDRDDFKDRAASAKHKHTLELTDYKKTDNYREYQTYLKDFKAKAAGPASESKRAKFDPESSDEAHSGHEILESPLEKRRRREGSIYSAGSTASGSPSVPDVVSKTSYLKVNDTTRYSVLQSPTQKTDHCSQRRRSTASSSASRPYHPRYGDASNSSSSSSMGSAAHQNSQQDVEAPTRYASISSSAYAPLQYMPSGPPVSSSSYHFGFAAGAQSAMRNTPWPLASQSPVPKIEPNGSSASCVPLQSILNADVTRSRRILPVPVTQTFAANMASEFRPPLVTTEPIRPHPRHNSSNTSGSVQESPIDTLLRASEMVGDFDHSPSGSADPQQPLPPSSVQR